MLLILLVAYLNAQFPIFEKLGYFGVVPIIALALLLLKAYVKYTTGICRSSVSLVGKTAIVTGSNTGIGFETALDLAKRGAKVILACRNQELGEEARIKIIDETNNPNVVLKLVDLGSFSSVRRFAEDINATEDRLDILVNNAGVGASKGEKSSDGLIWLMQVNYFGPFLLTNLLLNLLKKSGSSRIVNVSSLVAKYCNSLDITDLNKFVGPVQQYCVSKLCNIHFTIELAKKLKGSAVTTNSLHPGVVATELARDMPKVMRVVFNLLVKSIFKSSFEGAQTSIYLAVDKSVECISGEHFSDCKHVERYERAKDSFLTQNLWNITEELVKLTDEEKQY